MVLVPTPDPALSMDRRGSRNGRRNIQRSSLTSPKEGAFQPASRPSVGGKGQAEQKPPKVPACLPPLLVFSRMASPSDIALTSLLSWHKHSPLWPLRWPLISGPALLLATLPMVDIQPYAGCHVTSCDLVSHPGKGRVQSFLPCGRVTK